MSPAQDRKEQTLMMRTRQTATEMIKVPAKLYRIGDIVRYTPFSRQTLHNYTTMGLIREAEWTQGGHRLYDESVFAQLSKIMEMKKDNKSLFEIRKILSMEQNSIQPKVTGPSIDNN
jgi:DNA-binding transcriptional MerR regulator